MNIKINSADDITCKPQSEKLKCCFEHFGINVCAYKPTDCENCEDGKYNIIRYSVAR